MQAIFRSEQNLHKSVKKANFKAKMLLMIAKRTTYEMGEKSPAKTLNFMQRRISTVRENLLS